MPDPDLSSLARALGRVPTGLYVVTTRDEGVPLGFVGSLVMQVGFEPPTLSVAIGRDRAHLAAIRRAERFAVCVLDGPSSGLMGPFFKRYPEGESAFDHVATTDSPTGLPILIDALAWFDCATSGEHDVGDHIVVFGTVEHAELLRAGDPSIHLRQNGLDY